MAASYSERFEEWQKARFSPPPEPELTPTKPSFLDMVPMRDKVRLYTEVFLPANKQEPAPAILMRSPYPFSLPSRNDKRPISRYQDEGYAVVYQLTRGQGKSEGRYRRYIDDINDGYDCIEWIEKQYWCNGCVGMEGPSYLGTTQLLAAKSKPRALKCIMPTAFVGNSLECSPFVNGVPLRGNFLQWNKVLDAESMSSLDFIYGDANIHQHPTLGPAMYKRPLLEAADNVLEGDKLESWKEIIANPTDCEYWQSISYSDHDLSNLSIPTFFTDGWYDMTRGPIDFFVRLESLQPARPDCYLLVGPWNHGQTYAAHSHGQSNGEREMQENGQVDLVSLRLAFYDHYLKDEASNEKLKDLQPNRVRVYITGSPDSNANVWKDYPTFPPPNVKVHNMYLQSEGNANSLPDTGFLTLTPPEKHSRLAPSDIYIYDPDVPTPSESEAMRDRRSIEVRSDVVTYTSAPLTEPLTILGHIKLVLYAASDAPDTDWFATLTEIFPNGKSVAFHHSVSAIRARYRHGLDREIPLRPNEVERLNISLGFAGHQVAAGNCLRLSIFSAAFPKCDPNTNTGNNVATDTDVRVAKQTVFHTVSNPSHLSIPVITL
ncbi:CocE/NonD family hydrolase [Exilibacterium tricleocarpae]|uniref:CocE/NonD family hydrolase n=1 Tax=Exilibacterium tricleocarpae TaxID=2591008 RepID=A0A545SSS5_9GAMM|nr:CocE/NonD family hydrolase [Exilibacterium tricleocarpae]TQV68021.1 CocE/NonD family hydrolase [Exilibacterium tricleocarpae]